MAKWTHGQVAHLRERHDLSVAEAEEALHDPSRVTMVPDPASRSGRGIRVVGYSRSAGTVLCVLIVEHEGVMYGATAFPANATYRRIYQEGE
ncbi:BrnT-like toxin [Mycobacterium phage Feyre]